MVTEWNSTFAGVVLDLGLGVEVCWPYSPRQKGAVEKLVGWVGSFFKQRRFLDEADLERQLAEWHQEVNVQRPSRATGVAPAARIAEERARLRPLKVAPEELALRFPVMVGPTAMVMHEGRAYSMPPEAIGEMALAKMTQVSLCADSRTIALSVFHQRPQQISVSSLDVTSSLADTRDLRRT